MSTNTIEINGLSKTYGTNQALDDVTITLEKGKIYGLLGPNGSGKTTLIKILAGLLQQTRGNITINGKNPGADTKKFISYLPDRDFLPDRLSIKDVLAFYEDFFDDFRMDRAMEMLNSLNLNMNSKIKELSKGNREKVQLILVMSRKAEYYILDEPIGGVDPAAREFIISTIINNYDPDATIIISTHLISEIENILDDVIFIKNGRIALFDSVDNIRSTSNQSIDALFREVFRC